MKARRLISILLAILLACSTACFAAFAADDVTETVSVSSGAVTVGNVKVENSKRAVEVTAEEESASVKVQGNVTLTNINNEELNGATAVAVDSYGYLAAADISGNVSLEGGNDLMGIAVHDGNAKVGGNVSAKGGNYITAVAAYADEKTDVVVAGSASSEGYCATGVSVKSYPGENGGGEVNVKVGGITATGKEPVTDTDYDGYGSGIDLYRGAGDINVEVIGNITATNNGGYATGVYLSDCYEELMSSTFGTNTIIVRGDVVSDGYGIECYPLSGYNEDGTPPSGGTTDILIEGTMDAKKAGFATYSAGGYEGPVVIIDTPDGIGGSEIINDGDYEAEEPETNVNLTVWKIKLNENGSAAEWAEMEESVFSDQPEPEEPEYYTAENFEKNINYIIKVTQPDEGGTIKVVKADGSALAQSFELDVAREGDKIIIDASGIEKGYKIAAAYNGEDEKLPLETDEDGNYYIVVPKGGGISLSVELEKDSSGEEETEETTIELGEFKDTLGYKETQTFTAASAGMPEGAEIQWFVNGEETGKGDSYTVKEPTENYKVQAKAVKDGEVIAETEEVEVTVKNGFFDKLEAFFLDIIEKILGKAIADFLSSIC